MDAPRIGDTVHYVSFGTPGGEYTSQCRAAVVTETGISGVATVRSSSGEKVCDMEMAGGPGEVSLCVLNPTGQFFNRGVQYHDGGETPSNELHCAQASAHGHPFRYCACGWAEAAFRSGTWHYRSDCDR